MDDGGQGRSPRVAEQPKPKMDPPWAALRQPECEGDSDFVAWQEWIAPRDTYNLIGSMDIVDQVAIYRMFCGSFNQEETADG